MAPAVLKLVQRNGLHVLNFGHHDQHDKQGTLNQFRVPCNNLHELMGLRLGCDTHEKKKIIGIIAQAYCLG